MNSTTKQVPNEDADKLLLVEFDKNDGFSHPSRCDHIILIMCTDGEAELEINYITYKLHKNGILILVPLDIAHLKSASGDFRCKALMLPHNVYTPLIVNLDVAYFNDLKQYPIVNFESPHLELIKQFFSMLETAKNVFDYDDFKAFTERLVLAAFVLQKNHYKRLKNKHSMQPVVLMRKKELFRKFVGEIVKSYNISREVLYYANELGMSSGYLNEICNEVSSHSAKEIIDSAVVSKLKYELSFTSKSIQEITDEYNFPSQSYFSRYFKRITGVTPSAFRSGRTRK